jgi:hypothetical protein
VCSPKILELRRVASVASCETAAAVALAGQDDQKSRIFQYFASPAFYERMAAIAEAFQQMQGDLAREKAAMNRAWAKREKQIETIVSSTAKFTGELQALCGSALPQLSKFALPGE